MYEGMYTGALKQKAAGEAAKAKEKAKVAEDIEKSINVDPSKYHYSMQNLVKEKSAEAVTKMRDAIAEDNVRGINKANDIKRDLLIDLAGMANASSQLFEREKPTYTSTYIRPEVTFSKLNSMDIREAAKDPEVAKELADYGWQINVDDKGRVSINFSDIKYFDVRKDYNTFQGDIIDQFAPELAEKFKAGRTTRQELSQVITKERSDAYLDMISSDPIGGRSAVFNWKKKYYVDITTPEGKKKVYETFVAPERSGFTSGPGVSINVGGGGQVATSPVVSGAELDADTGFNWSPSARTDQSGDYYVLQYYEKLNGKNLIFADEKGTPIKFETRREAEEYLANNGKFKYEAIQTLNLDVPSVGITIPANQKSFTIGEEGSNTGYGERVKSNTFSMKVNRLETVETYTGGKTLTFGLFRLENGDIIPETLLSKVPADKREKKVFVVGEVESSYKTNASEARDRGGTVYVPATKQNISAIISKLPATEKATRKMLEDINSGKQKLGDGKIIGAATKGAGKQTGAEAPQSTFNLLDIPTA